MTLLARGDYVRLLSAVYAAMFLVRVAFGIVVVTFASYVPADDFVYSLVVTASPLLELLTIVFAGVLIDRYGRKSVLLTGLGLAAFSLFGLALTREVLLLGLVNAIHGVSAALILVTTLAVIATYAPADQRGRAMGIFNLVNLFGWISGFVLGELLADAFEGRLQYTFVLAGLLATGGLLYANRMIQLRGERAAAPPGHRATLADLGRAVRDKNMLLLTAPWLIVFMLVGAFITFFPRVTDRLDISGGSTALAFLGMGALMLASQYFWGGLADRKGREAIMLVGGIGLALLMALIAYAFFDTASSDPEVIFTNVMSHGVLLSVLLFVALAFAPAGLAAIADEAQDGTQGTTMSAYSLTLSLGFIIGPPILGAVSERFGGPGMVIFYVVLAFALFTMVLTRFLQMRLARRRAAA